MRGLDPNSDADRRITAFRRMVFLEDWEHGSIRAGLISYDCWGKQQGGRVDFTTTPEYFAKYGGQKSYITLELEAMGCCPPQLTKDFIEREGELVERDPVEEAMKLHKRGYFGGGG